MWFTENPSQFSVETAQGLTCSIMEKPPTGLVDCLNMLPSCFRKRMSLLSSKALMDWSSRPKSLLLSPCSKIFCNLTDWSSRDWLILSSASDNDLICCFNSDVVFMCMSSSFFFCHFQMAPSPPTIPAMRTKKPMASLNFCQRPIWTYSWLDLVLFIEGSKFAFKSCGYLWCIQITVSSTYRVSHPIVHEISSCFVLGVPLSCLGSS